jgi:hypothetical protein
MRLKLAVGVMCLLVLSCVFVAPAFGKGTGFDQYGYNDTARVFVGSVWSWALAGNGGNEVATKTFLDGWWDGSSHSISFYEQQGITMKWNAEWDRGNAEGWTASYYAAWTINEYHGVNMDGTHWTWHYKIVWVGSALEGSPHWRPGGYAIWEQFEVIMDMGTDAGVHYWYAHVAPNGLGGI